MDVKNSIISKPTLPQSVDTPQVSLLKSHKQSIIGTLDPCNKKRRVTKNGLQEECNLVSRQWENLDSNILRIIYSRVPVQDLFLNVSSVCLSWEAACWDYMFWSRNVVDLSATGAGLGISDISDVVSLVKFKSEPVPGIYAASDSSEKYKGMATSLMRKLCRIFEGQSIQGWTDSIQTIILPYDLEISDTHLLYIAERTPRLQHLILLCPCKITASGFTRTIQNWKHLKEIHIGSLENYAFIHFLEEMGRNCKELEILHIHQEDFKVDGAIATVVAKSLPGLKKMEFELGDMRPTGVVSLFEMCLKLEEMRFSCCALKHDYDFPAEYPESSIFERCCSFNLFWIDTGEADGEWKVEPKIESLEECKETVERFKFNFTGEELYHFITSEEYKAIRLSDFEKWVTDSRSWTLMKRPFSAQREKQIIEKYTKKFIDRTGRR